MQEEPSRHCGPALQKFRKRIQEKYNVKIENFWDLHKWSIENVPEFWAEVWQDSGLIYSKTFNQVIDMKVKMSDSPKWFQGARLNFAENLLRYRDEHPALILAGEERTPETVSYAQLYAESCVYGAALRKFGVKAGDRVACYMSNRKEAILAMLGATSLGAIFTGDLPLLGAQAVKNRFELVGPKIIFTIDTFLNNGKRFDMLTKLEELAKNLPTLEKIVIVPSSADSTKKDISRIGKSCFLDSFLALARDAAGSVPPLEFEQVSFSHPVFITYTSGTTGPPKAVVHGIGALLSIIRNSSLHGERSSRNFANLSMSPVGWVSWNASIMSLFGGFINVQFEGVPFFLSPTYIWDLVDELKVSCIFITPAIADDLQKKGYLPTEKHNLESLKAIFVGASVVKAQNFDFVMSLKKDISFWNVYGSTEFMGSCLTMDQTLPVHKHELTAPCYATDVQCYDDAGRPVVGQLGELVIRTPMPSLPLGLWGDPDGALFRKHYFSKYRDVYAQGDLCTINPATKGFTIYGRSDDTLKPKGCRFGSAEIYNVVDLFPEVLDSLCVSQYRKEDLEERAVLFVKLRPDCAFDERLVKSIKDTIDKELSDEHVPEIVLQVRDIPYNMNGKKMEIAVKKIINNMPYNPETIINPECLDSFRNISELAGY